ncbi:MAG: type II secretion system protein [Candidatus Paceibacterota bacterium]|jgi:prepilin-type N-terminal cleavage/methylation domain-containing protein
MMNKSIYNKGMTLVEILVAIAIFLVVLGALMLFFKNIFSYRTVISGSYETTQQAQAILKTMLTEIRQMSPGANGAYALALSGTSTIAFYSDSNADGVKEKITYERVGTDLYRRQIIPSGSTYNPASQTSSIIVRSVRNENTSPIFEYFNEYYNGTSSPLVQPVTTTQVRLVKINLRLDIDPNLSPVPVMFTTQTSIRNIKTNL